MCQLAQLRARWEGEGTTRAQRTELAAVKLSQMSYMIAENTAEISNGYFHCAAHAFILYMYIRVGSSGALIIHAKHIYAGLQGL